MQDTLKISGNQVTPTEIEETLRQHPGGLIVDVAVAGVPGARTEDEKVPRAWVVLSDAGKRRGADAVFAVLDDWIRSRLSKHRWIRGGFESVDKVRDAFITFYSSELKPSVLNTITRYRSRI